MIQWVFCNLGLQYAIMSPNPSQASQEQPYLRFDTFLKMLLLYDEYGVLSFLLLQLGYTLVSFERLSNELYFEGKHYQVDALFKAKVKLPNGSIIEVCIDIEFQHRNDPKMADRIYDYRKAIQTIHDVKVVLPVLVYTGEHKCTMELFDDDLPFKVFPFDIPKVDITQLESEIFTTHSSAAVHFLAILNHRSDPAILAQLLYDDLQRIKNTKGVAEMNRWFNFLLSVTTSKNKRAMRIRS
jgi:hypothetical protein